MPPAPSPPSHSKSFYPQQGERPSAPPGWSGFRSKVKYAERWPFTRPSSTRGTSPDLTTGNHSSVWITWGLGYRGTGQAHVIQDRFPGPLPGHTQIGGNPHQGQSGRQRIGTVQPGRPVDVPRLSPVDHRQPGGVSCRVNLGSDRGSIGPAPDTNGESFPSTCSVLTEGIGKGCPCAVVQRLGRRRSAPIGPRPPHRNPPEQV